MITEKLPITEITGLFVAQKLPLKVAGEVAARMALCKKTFWESFCTSAEIHGDRMLVVALALRTGQLSLSRHYIMVQDENGEWVDSPCEKRIVQVTMKILSGLYAITIVNDDTIEALGVTWRRTNSGSRLFENEVPIHIPEPLKDWL